MPYTMAIMWLAALAAIPLHQFTDEGLFLITWAMPTFVTLVGGLSGLMTLWDFPETREQRPRLRTTILVMMGIGALLFWAGLAIYLRNHHG